MCNTLQHTQRSSYFLTFSAALVLCRLGSCAKPREHVFPSGMAGCRCYTCAWTAGWTGNTGKSNCDALFLSNLYKACEYHYPQDSVNRASCRTTAETMFAAVSVGGQRAWTSSFKACTGDAYKLATADFCFEPVYRLNGIVSYIRPGNGREWGTWTNFAQVGGDGAVKN